MTTLPWRQSAGGSTVPPAGYITLSTLDEDDAGANSLEYSLDSRIAAIESSIADATVHDDNEWAFLSVTLGNFTSSWANLNLDWGYYFTSGNRPSWLTVNAAAHTITFTESGFYQIDFGVGSISTSGSAGAWRIDLQNTTTNTLSNICSGYGAATGTTNYFTMPPILVNKLVSPNGNSFDAAYKYGGGKVIGTIDGVLQLQARANGTGGGTWTGNLFDSIGNVLVRRVQGVRL